MPAPLLDRLTADLVAAMKAHDTLRLGVLRLTKSAISNWELTKDYVATDEDILELIAKQVKQRRDAAAQYIAGGRPELAAQEEAEIAVLQAYLPEQLSEDALRAIVQETVAEVGATSMKEMGKVMGALMPKVKGKADGTVVKRLLEETLAK